MRYGENGKIIQYNAVKVQFFPTEEQADLEIQLRELAKELVSNLSVLDSTKSKNLLGAFVSDLFLSVVEQECREFRRQKQAEGIAATKARGVKFGPSRKPLPDGFNEYRQQWRDGKITMRETADACGMAKSSFYDAVMRKEQSADCAI